MKEWYWFIPVVWVGAAIGAIIMHLLTTRVKPEKGRRGRA